MATKKTATKATPKPAARAPKGATTWTLVPVLDARNRAKLSAVQLEQLAVLATFYDGLATTTATIPTGLFSQWVRLSKLHERGVHRFDVWMIGSDEGCVFWKDDKEPVGIEVIQGGWGAYPKRDWVVRGLALDLRHLAWELGHRDGPEPAGVVPVPEPAPQKTEPMRWKARRTRKNPEDCG